MSTYVHNAPGLCRLTGLSRPHRSDALVPELVDIRQDGQPGPALYQIFPHLSTHQIYAVMCFLDFDELYRSIDRQAFSYILRMFTIVPVSAAFFCVLEHSLAAVSTQWTGWMSIVYSERPGLPSTNISFRIKGFIISQLYNHVSSIHQAQ